MFRKDELVGKVVVEASGKSLGKAKDLAFGLDGTVVLIVEGNESQEVQVSMDRIAGVADYIVVRREGVVPKRPAPGVQQAVPVPSAPQAAESTNPLIPPPRTPASAEAPTSSSPTAASTSNSCKSCGAQLRPGAKFCTKCGTPV